MANELQIFEDPEFGKLRTASIDGEPWFVGKDVAVVLGYKDTINALKAHVDEDDRMGWQITTPSRGKQEMTIINESGVYSLVFGSKLPKAKEFKRWVTSEILPSIRRTGGYYASGKPMSAAEQLLAQARVLVEQEHEISRLRIQNEAQGKALDILSSRMDTFLGTGTSIDKRQKLNDMVRAFAVKRGIQFTDAWQQWKSTYNAIYRTNLKLAKRAYMQKHGQDSMTIPAYLAASGHIDDALVIADKLLNGAEKEVGGLA